MLATAQQNPSVPHPVPVIVILPSTTPYERQLARETLVRCLRRFGAVRVRAGDRSLKLQRGEPGQRCACGAPIVALLRAVARRARCGGCLFGELGEARSLRVEALSAAEPQNARRMAPLRAPRHRPGAGRRVAQHRQ